MRSPRSCTFTAIVFVLALVGCKLPTPHAAAEPIGELPRWGEGFTVPTAAPASALGGTSSAAPVKPGETGDWGGGDATLGKGVWVAMCARCHGAAGEGGTMPDGKAVASVADAAWQAKTSDRDMARTIAVGKEPMPSFMKELDRAKLSGVIAYIRTLKK